MPARMLKSSSASIKRRFIGVSRGQKPSIRGFAHAGRRRACECRIFPSGKRQPRLRERGQRSCEPSKLLSAKARKATRFFCARRSCLYQTVPGVRQRRSRLDSACCAKAGYGGRRSKRGRKLDQGPHDPHSQPVKRGCYHNQQDSIANKRNKALLTEN
jgi:hypothetical protein